MRYKQLLSKIERLQRFAAKVPAMAFLLAYIFMVPAFAFYYDLRATEFYHSTAKYEAEVLRDRENLRAILELTVKDQFIQSNGTPSKQSGEWLVDINEFRISRASFEDGRLILKMYMRFTSTQWGMIAGSKVFYVDVKPAMVVGLPGSKGQYVLKFPHSDKESVWPVSNSEIFPALKNMITPSGSIAISTDVQARITHLDNSFRGFPALSTGAYGRMLYFSSVTQTTLGYGDVVPISNRTRIVVGLQSVAGIILIGFFLNSLAAATSAESRRKKGL